MLLLLQLCFTSVYVLTVHVAAAVTTEAVVGVAGRTVTLPCRLEAANRRGVEVCWGRGEPSLFTCHNAVISATQEKISYKRSNRYSVSSSSLNILNSGPADSGFYHCRVQLPGLFNDQTSTVHLIIISPRSVASSSEESNQDTENQSSPHATASYSIRDQTQDRGSDVSTTGPVVAQVQQLFIGNTLRLSFIIFIPVLLLSAAHRVWTKQRSDTDRTMDQSEEENSSV
ncbi:hepatitis A virus cellular receptor 1 homolog isoform X2 [Anabas testudineus]|uniref:hepatitis A virus cellular receptor 1 homolog isoform X2 n=1 Tax=Anabas testudineus TaxID=64144 RepID=UPI000E464948|nr:hepatitis A virus cellular receptor 1 homolog isoform X2 [Anabas testudineus]